MHCPIALAESTSAFDVRRCFRIFEMISRDSDSPADNATRKFSA